MDLFERLNTGGVKLTDHEVRESVYMGEFVNLLTELAESDSFKTVVILPHSRVLDGTPQDYVLRFFAFLDGYKSFKHSVKDFLNDFCRDAALEPELTKRREIFFQSFSFLSGVFPRGLRTRKGTTAVNLFEAVAVGAALALSENPRLAPPEDPDWVRSDELRSLTTGATNDKNRVSGRIEYCRDMFLGRK